MQTSTHSSKLEQPDAESVARLQNKAWLKTKAVLFWRCLMQQGVPYHDARHIAIAIAKYDVNHKYPNPRQKALIMQYSALVCRAKLWRSRLLIDASTLP
jgi:hypothetical protein